MKKVAFLFFRVEVRNAACVGRYYVVEGACPICLICEMKKEHYWLAAILLNPASIHTSFVFLFFGCKTVRVWAFRYPDIYLILPVLLHRGVLCKPDREKLLTNGVLCVEGKRINP